MLVRGALLIADALIVLGGADTSWPETPPASSTALAPYLATPQDVVDRMLTLADVTAGFGIGDSGFGIWDSGSRLSPNSRPRAKSPKPKAYLGANGFSSALGP